MAWPLTEPQLRATIAADETELVDRKARWYALDTKHGKGELIKDVIAMANASSADDPGLLLIGVNDRRHGGGVVGLTDRIDSEQLQHLVSAYVSPPPVVRLEHRAVAKKQVVVIGIFGSSDHIYRAIRELDQTKPDVAYVRRGDIILHMTIAEMEERIRNKALRLGGSVAIDPLKYGFVEVVSLSSGGALTLRVANVSDETVSGIDVVFDVVWQRHPYYCYRVPRLSGAQLEPGASREVSLARREMHIYGPDQKEALTGGTLGERWFNVTGIVRYRDREGFLQERRMSVTVAD